MLLRKSSLRGENRHLCTLILTGYPGVMRFLHMEWHNHERARNAWDIERAEMKLKIAKQEGEVRSSKRLNEQLERQIRMLEHALKNERAKNKAPASGEKPPTDEENRKAKDRPFDALRTGLFPLEENCTAEVGTLTFSMAGLGGKPHNSFLDLEDSREPTEAEKDAQRDKSKLYLTKCVEEITYLLTPPSHPPPAQSLQDLANSGAFLGRHESSMPLEDMYIQQRQKGQQQSLGHATSMPNHQPPPVPTVVDVPNYSHTNQPSQQATYMTRDPPSHQPLSQPSPLPTSDATSHQQPSASFQVMSEEPVERVTHSYDGFGRPVQPRDEDVPRQVITDETDSWNFDEGSTALESAPEVPAPRRPDTDAFPSANSIPAKSPPRAGPGSHRRKSSGSTAMQRRRSEGHEVRDSPSSQSAKSDAQNFKVRFALRGHLDVVRAVIFTGGGSPAEPEICTAGDDGLIKRWIIPASYANQHSMTNDLDILSYFTHRGHEGIVTSLAACPASANFSTGGRVSGDGWIFSGGQDGSVRVWERGRVDPKATLDGHTDAVWTVCVLPITTASLFGSDAHRYGGPDRVLLASGSADGTIKIWAVSAPPQIASPSTGSRRGVGGSRRHSVTSGSNYPSSPQPSVATSTPFNYTLVHTIERAGTPSPTCIAPLSPTGETFVVSYSDAAVLIFDTRTGEEIIGMASNETYDGTPATAINCVAATSVGPDGNMSMDSGRGLPEDEGSMHGATGTTGGVEGIVISGHEDQFIRFFDANSGAYLFTLNSTCQSLTATSGQCTYSMLAHPSAISSLSLGKDGREAVSAGHDASIRFWSLDKRVCTQEITSHRIMRGEGVCCVVWSQDGRLVVSAGGDGVVKVFAR